MSLVAYNSYYAMITRGSCDLAMIDAALAKKYITTAEADKLRAYWHQLNDPKAVLNFAASVSADGVVTVTWSSPSRNQIALGYTGIDGEISEEVPSGGFAAVLASAPTTGTTLEISARHVTPGGTGPVATATATYPEPAPEPTPEPTPEPASEVPTDVQNDSATTGGTDAGAPIQES